MRNVNLLPYLIQKTNSKEVQQNIGLTIAFDVSVTTNIARLLYVTSHVNIWHIALKTKSVIRMLQVRVQKYLQKALNNLDDAGLFVHILKDSKINRNFVYVIVNYVNVFNCVTVKIEDFLVCISIMSYVIGK